MERRFERPRRTRSQHVYSFGADWRLGGFDAVIWQIGRHGFFGHIPHLSRGLIHLTDERTADGSATDGAIVRVVFPELTEERRRDFTKLAKQYAEDGKVAVRNVRRHARDNMQRLEDDGDVGQDEHERYAKRLEEMTAKHVHRIDDLLEHKEKELLEV